MSIRSMARIARLDSCHWFWVFLLQAHACLSSWGWRSCFSASARCDASIAGVDARAKSRACACLRSIVLCRKLWRWGARGTIRIARSIACSVSRPHFQVSIRWNTNASLGCIKPTHLAVATCVPMSCARCAVSTSAYMARCLSPRTRLRLWFDTLGMFYR